MKKTVVEEARELRERWINFISLLMDRSRLFRLFAVIVVALGDRERQ